MDITFSEKKRWLPVSSETLYVSGGPVVTGTASALTCEAFHFAAAVSAFIFFFSTITVFKLTRCSTSARAEKTDSDVSPSGPGEKNKSILPVRMNPGGTVMIILSLLSGGYLVLRGGWAVALMIALFFSVAVFLSKSGADATSGVLEEFAAFTFSGVIAVGLTAYAQALFLPGMTLIYAIPAGLTISSITCVFNAEKRNHTSFTFIPKTAAKYSFLIFSAYVFPFCIWLADMKTPWIMLPFLTFPAAFGLVQEIWQTGGVTLENIRERTARLSFMFTMLLSAGILI